MQCFPSPITLSPVLISRQDWKLPGKCWWPSRSPSLGYLALASCILYTHRWAGVNMVLSFWEIIHRLLDLSYQHSHWGGPGSDGWQRDIPPLPRGRGGWGTQAASWGGLGSGTLEIGIKSYPSLLKIKHLTSTCASFIFSPMWIKWGDKQKIEQREKYHFGRPTM